MPDISPWVWRILVLTVVGVGGPWLSVVYFFSRFGWRAFAARHPASHRPVGRAYWVPNLNFGVSGAFYKYGVRLIFSPSGVYFRPLFLFRMFHAPFVVPWSSVKRAEKVNVFLQPRYHIEIDDIAGEIRLEVPIEAEQDLMAFYKPG